MSAQINPNQEKKNLQRIFWIDNLRAIGIFFVVLIHTGRMTSFLTILIVSFFMPLFFFISGLFAKDFIKNISFQEFFNLRLRRLLIPYFFFNLVSYILWVLLFRHFDKGANIPIVKPLIGIFYGVAPGDWLIHNIALWFFTCLIMTEILFYIIIRLPSQNYFIGALLLCSIIGYGLLHFLNQIPFKLPWNLDLAFIALVFYGVGYLSKSYILNDIFIKWHRWLVIITCLICYITFSFVNREVVFVMGFFGNYFYFFIAAFSGILFWTHIARLIKPYPLLTAIGQNSLVIFSLHLLVFPFITGFLLYGFKIPKNALEHSNIIAIIYSVITILLLIKCSEILQKYIPWVLGK